MSEASEKNTNCIVLNQPEFAEISEKIVAELGEDFAGKIKIIILDDDFGNSLFVAMAKLEGLGVLKKNIKTIQIQAENDFQKVVDEIEANGMPHLFLIDQNMKKTSGTEFAEFLKEKFSKFLIYESASNSEQIPPLLISNSSEKKTSRFLIEIVKSGMHGYFKVKHEFTDLFRKILKFGKAGN